MLSNKMFKGRAWRLIPAVIGATMVVTGLSATTAAHAATPIVPGKYTITATPTSVVAGSTTAYSVTITNASPPDSVDLLTAASFTLPSGFSGVSATSPQSGWTVGTSGNTVSISGGSLIPNASVTIGASATAPGTAGVYTWSSTASGLIGGVTASSFDRVGPEPSTTVTPATPSKVGFVQQPTNTKTGVAISPAIKVAVQDAFGNTVTTSSASVTLSTAYNPNTGNATNPSGNLPQTAAASAGIATFSNVIINQSGDNYRLSASSSGLTSATSNAFREDTVVNSCAPNTTCTSQTLSSNGTTAKVTDETGAQNDVYTLALDNPNADQCGKPVSGNEATFTNQDLSRYLTVTMTLASSKRISGKTYGICFANKTSFITKSGAPATLGTDGFWHGYLANCSTNGNQKPCLVSLTDNCGTLTAVFRSPPGDPRGMFGVLG
ncbi:MAG: hypothetical protein QOG53_1485 [Frankiales bacterium]|jgi:hypothetical protein|nr:hypothetical protein [Frankiales bacterium]